MEGILGVKRENNEKCDPATMLLVSPVRLGEAWRNKGVRRVETVPAGSAKENQ